MDWIYVLAIVLGIVGIAGCIVPFIPGPPISYLGLVVLYIWGNADEYSGRFMLIWLVVTAIVTILDYIIPSYFTRIYGGSKSTGRASLVGMIIGIIFFPPLGMIFGAFLGALVGEMFIGGKDFQKALKPAWGSFLGFLAGTGMKLIISVMMFVKIL